MLPLHTDASDIFSKVIYLGFRELVDIIVSYFDEVIVYSKYLNHYLSHFIWTFKVVKMFHFTLRPDNYLFFPEEAELLEYIISSDKIKPASKTLDKVAKFELSKNKTELKLFIHLYRFHMEHVQLFVQIASFLTNLLTKGNKFIFSSKKKSQPGTY